MDWVKEARHVFKADRPDHFTNYMHCEECAEHDNTLSQSDIDAIGLDELGNPGWDPICFCTNEGKKYYMPAFIRLSLETIYGESYLGQFLFHLEGNGEDNELYASCSRQQREFIASFVEHMINSYPKELESGCHADEALRVHQIWSKE